MFNLKHDGGIFIGLCDNGEAAQGTKPCPQGTGVTWKGVLGTVISVPQPSAICNLPDSEASLSPYIVKLSNSNYGNDGIIEVSPVEMPHLTQSHGNSHSGGSVGLLPHWIGQDQKVMFSKDGKHHKCHLDHIEDVGWHVSHCH